MASNPVEGLFLALQYATGRRMRVDGRLVRIDVIDWFSASGSDGTVQIDMETKDGVRTFRLTASDCTPESAEGAESRG